jgi:hypothetical protein
VATNMALILVRPAQHCFEAEFKDEHINENYFSLESGVLRNFPAVAKLVCQSTAQRREGTSSEKRIRHEVKGATGP